MPSELAHLPLRIPAWSFADRIRKVRRDARLTIGEMADAINVGEKAYGAWESGRNTPASIIEVAVKLERVTGVPRTWFLGWDDEKAPTVNGEGQTLPGLDSNQEPIGSQPDATLIPFPERADAAATVVDGDVAPVIDLASKRVAS